LITSEVAINFKDLIFVPSQNTIPVKVKPVEPILIASKKVIVKVADVVEIGLPENFPT